MSVSSSTSRVQYNCNSSTVDFAFTFGVGATSEIQVIYTTAAGVETILTETTDYTVAATNNDYSSGGTVTTVATYATGTTITILRNVPLTQAADFTEGMATLYETFEDGLDKLTRIAQQFNEELGRALLLKKSDDTSVSLELPLKADRLSKFLAFDSDGEPIAAAGTAGSSTVPISSAMEPVLSAATVAAAMLLLLPGGTARQAIQMNAGATALEFVTSLAGLLTAQGDTVYASAANTLARLAKGTAYQAYGMNSGATAPAWMASLQSLMTAQGDTVYASGANTPARLAIGAANTKKFTNAAGTAPEWGVGLKIGSFSRAMDAASGDVSYTGVGFKPSVIIFISTYGAYSTHWAITDASAVLGAGMYGTGPGYTTSNNATWLIESAGSKDQSAVVKTWDSDGFTLTWTRTGATASGTAWVWYLAIR